MREHGTRDRAFFTIATASWFAIILVGVCGTQRESRGDWQSEWCSTEGATRGRYAKFGGYGSMVPCIPSILELADIPQLVSLVCPRPLAIIDPVWANGKPVPAGDLPSVFAWTRHFYKVSGSAGA